MTQPVRHYWCGYTVSYTSCCGRLGGSNIDLYTSIKAQLSAGYNIEHNDWTAFWGWRHEGWLSDSKAKMLLFHTPVQLFYILTVYLHYCTNTES